MAKRSTTKPLGEATMAGEGGPGCCLHLDVGGEEGEKCKRNSASTAQAKKALSFERAMEPTRMGQFRQFTIVSATFQSPVFSVILESIPLSDRKLRSRPARLRRES